MRQDAGFTIVELVMVILLIGILSVSAIPLFSSKDSFSTRIASEQLVSQFQLAQRVALGMSAQASPVSLAIRADSDTWYFSVTKVGLDPAMASGQETYTVDVEYGNANLSVDGASLSAGNTRTFAWDSAANLSPYQNHEIRIQAERAYLICLSATGYAYIAEARCL